MKIFMKEFKTKKEILEENEEQREAICLLKEDIKLLEFSEENRIVEISNLNAESKVKDDCIDKLKTELKEKELILTEAIKDIEKNKKIIEKQYQEINAHKSKNREMIDQVEKLEKKSKRHENRTMKLQKELLEVKERNVKLTNELTSRVTMGQIVKQQLRELCIYKGHSQHAKTKSQVLVSEKVSGVKVWDLTNLL